jgi:hypothetical protein
VSGPLGRLRPLADLVRDRALGELRRTAADRAAVEAAIAALVAAPPPPEASPAEHANALRHAIWADARRAQLNLTLAQRTAAWLEARDAAARAHGRAEALARLAARADGRPREGR